MNKKNPGLTVGELSITIAVLIIVGFLWTNLNKKKNDQDISMNNQSNYHYVSISSMN
tara:strand:- start:238 stop:408 length:171 start_codon:yes stop_codon:yes gene_type:complete